MTFKKAIDIDHDAMELRIPNFFYLFILQDKFISTNSLSLSLSDRDDESTVKGTRDN